MPFPWTNLVPRTLSYPSLRSLSCLSTGRREDLGSKLALALFYEPFLFMSVLACNCLSQHTMPGRVHLTFEKNIWILNSVIKEALDPPHENWALYIHFKTQFFGKNIVKAACKRTQQLPTLLGQQCWELLLACWRWCANGCNNPRQCWDLQCIVGRIQALSLC